MSFTSFLGREDNLKKEKSGQVLSIKDNKIELMNLKNFEIFNYELENQEKLKEIQEGDEIEYSIRNGKIVIEKIK